MNARSRRRHRRAKERGLRRELRKQSAVLDRGLESVAALVEMVGGVDGVPAQEDAADVIITGVTGVADWVVVDPGDPVRDIDRAIRMYAR